MATISITITAAEAVSLGDGNSISREALDRAKITARVMFESDPGKAALVTSSLKVKSLSIILGDYIYVFEVPDIPQPAPALLDDLSEPS